LTCARGNGTTAGGRVSDATDDKRGYSPPTAATSSKSMILNAPGQRDGDRSRLPGMEGQALGVGDLHLVAVGQLQPESRERPGAQDLCERLDCHAMLLIAYTSEF
jgi:hypothetical protein